MYSFHYLQLNLVVVVAVFVAVFIESNDRLGNVPLVPLGPPLR